jgi:hypothetical protein
MAASCTAAPDFNQGRSGAFRGKKKKDLLPSVVRAIFKARKLVSGSVSMKKGNATFRERDF